MAHSRRGCKTAVGSAPVPASIEVHSARLGHGLAGRRAVSPPLESGRPWARLALPATARRARECQEENAAGQARPAHPWPSSPLAEARPLGMGRPLRRQADRTVLENLAGCARTRRARGHRRDDPHLAAHAGDLAHAGWHPDGGGGRALGDVAGDAERCLRPSSRRLSAAGGRGLTPYLCPARAIPPNSQAESMAPTSRDMKRPWEIGKAFDGSAPCGALQPASKIGHPSKGRVALKANGKLRQEGDLAQMIWNVPEVIGKLSEMVALAAGDIIMTGTPSGVAATVPGDTLECEIEGVGSLTVTIGPPAR